MVNFNISCSNRPPDASKNPPDRTYASLRSDLVSNDQLRNWQIVLKKSGDGRKLSGTLTRVARGDGGADDDYCCPGRKGTGARGNELNNMDL